MPKVSPKSTLLNLQFMFSKTTDIIYFFSELSLYFQVVTAFFLLESLHPHDWRLVGIFFVLYC